METAVNWIEEERKGSFLSWLLLEAMSRAVEEENIGFLEMFPPFDPENLTVSMQVNGVEVPAREAVEYLRVQFDKIVEKEVQKQIAEKINDRLEASFESVDRIQADLENVRRALRKEMKELAGAKNVDFYDEG